ncbi:hypothetical protein BpHYR1_002549 [Brachionus plicatilis]|uniref:Uncharacterized protein n=1 Tax=Brachionus plicatilis TaxID=10195 RepID=A0A3M7QR70_BRAPC|nr:hypothetical protein BpHYR1_002549 [Brachionus plicatilis]
MITSEIKIWDVMLINRSFLVKNLFLLWDKIRAMRLVLVSRAPCLVVDFTTEIPIVLTSKANIDAGSLHFRYFKESLSQPVKFLFGQYPKSHS